MTIRDNLLVTAGARAAYMYCGGNIHLQGGLVGEDILADRITKMVDKYIERGKDENFDFYIERALLDEFLP